jgi:steroid delta-isomerase-like uncharacterized protein
VSNRKRYLEAWNSAFNGGNPDAFDGIMAADYVRHYSQSAGFNSLDATEFKSTLLAMRKGFPDIQSKIDDVVGEDSEFTIRWSSEGTHLNPFLGIPGTGKRIATGGVTVCRFKNNKLQEEWVAWNLQEVANGLGFRELRQQRADDVDGTSVGVDAALLRKAHGKFVTGVTVVAGSSPEGVPFGLAVNAFMSVSLEPPTIVVCISKTSRSHDQFLRARSFAVNILAADQVSVARQFAGSSADKFSGIAWAPGALGAPEIENCAAFFEVQITDCLRASTHTVFIGQVVSVKESERPPLVYMASGFFDPGNLQQLA